VADAAPFAAQPHPLRDDLLAIHAAAVRAVEPAEAVRNHLRIREGIVHAGTVPLPAGRIVVIAAGKAAAPMAAAAEDILGDRIAAGIAVTKDGHGCELRRCVLHEASHPEPDGRGVHAAIACLSLVRGLTADDAVLCLLSGGASALLPAPAAGLTLADVVVTTRLLLASGADIQAVNTVRKHLSTLAGGGLALAAAPARVATLALSDVPGDDPGVIGSGPTVPDPGTWADVAQVLERHGLAASVPAAVRARLADGLAGRIADTAKPGETRWASTSMQIIGSNRIACLAAAAEAARRGYVVEPIDGLSGEARVEAKRLVGRLATCRAGSGIRRALIAGGETTVVLGDRPGKGGRNQECALAAALAMTGMQGVALLAAGTDGTDGPTDAAGGLADPSTVERAAAAGFDARDHLARHDAYPLLAATGDLLITGPTRTNVMDIVVGLAGS
jgi:glycerate 2-kinase